LDGSLPPWRVLGSEPGSAPPPDESSPLPSRVAPWPIVLGAITLICLAVAVVVVLVSLRPTTGDGGVVSIQTTAVGGPDAIIVVEVEGAIAHPGVFRLTDGSRVGDAIAAAGGYSPRVDVASAEREINLATVLADGDRIVVPSRDDTAAGDATNGAEEPGSGTATLARRRPRTGTGCGAADRCRP